MPSPPVLAVHRVPDSGWHLPFLHSFLPFLLMALPFLKLWHVPEEVMRAFATRKEVHHIVP